ncbi:MAG: ABC transporter permease [Thermomicrobiales bacterium]
MAQITTTTSDLDLEREMDDARAAAITLRPAPGATPTLSSYADAEVLDGALNRAALRKTPGLYTRAWRIFRANKVAMTALVILTAIVVFVLSAGLISTYITGFTPAENHLSDKLKPVMTDGYILGSDGNGRDVLTRLAYGGRVSFTIAVLSAAGLFFIGGTVGLVAGYLGGMTDAIAMRLVDVLLSIPGLPLLILISTLFAPGPLGLALVLAGVSWAGIARLFRGETLALRQRDYIEAARALGASDRRIVLKHIVPNLVPLLVIYTSLSLPGLMLAETGLSFLGVGVQVPTPSWGNMLGDGQQFFRTHFSLVLIPGLMIYITSLSMYLVGNGLRDAFDPKLTQ